MGLYFFSSSSSTFFSRHPQADLGLISGSCPCDRNPDQDPLHVGLVLDCIYHLEEKLIPVSIPLWMVNNLVEVRLVRSLTCLDFWVVLHSPALSTSSLLLIVAENSYITGLVFIQTYTSIIHGLMFDQGRPFFFLSS